MKKWIVFLTVFLITFGMLTGCGSTAGEESGAANTFSVGYSKIVISPEKSVYLKGHNDPIEERMSTGVGDDLYANCIAMTDEDGQTIIFIATDLLYVTEKFSTPIRKEISELTGVPLDYIFLHCSHSHSGPDTSDGTYYQLLKTRCIQVAQEAMADRKPAQMYTTFTRPEKGITFVRHYLLSDGSYRAEKVGSVKKVDIIGHATQADDLLQLIKFTREGGKDVVLMNWQGHPWGNEPYSYTTATCNYPGIMRKTVEEGLDCLGVFVLSGSGNLNNASQIEEENQFATHLELGQGLGQLAIEAAANFQPAQTGKICLEKGILTRVRKAATEKDYDIQLYGFSFGEVAFATCPFEAFDTNAMAVKENSKFKMTFYASVTNDWQCYLPTPPSWDWEHQYEVRVTFFPKGTAEDVETEMRAIMDRLFEASGNEEAEKPEGYIHTIKKPATDGKSYVVLSAGDTTAYEAVNNGFFSLQLLNGTTLKKILVRDEALAQEILSRSTVSLLFDYQGVVTGIAE